MIDANNLLEKLVSIVTSYKFYVPVIALIVTIIMIKSSSKVVKKLINKDSKSLEAKRKNTIVALLQNIIKYIFIIIFVLIILSVWGVNVSGIITGLGVVGVVAGLAIQDALKDIIMGCNIIMDNYFVVGDIVTYNDFTGEVIEFGLKNTKIKSADGTVLIVSNRNIIEIKNLSQKSAAVMITVPTAYEENSDKVLKVLDKISKEIDSWEITTKPTEVLGVDSLSESSVDYLIKAYCEASNRFTLKRKVLGYIKDEFDKENIKIPYNQIEVHDGKRV